MATHLENLDALLPRDQVTILQTMWQSPAVQELTNRWESNTFHGGAGEESVLVHTLRVVNATTKFISGQVPVFPKDGPLQKRLQAFLVSAPSDCSTFSWKFFQLALAIAHDTGKATHIKVRPDGTTGSRGHEKASAIILERVFSYVQEQGFKLAGPVEGLLRTLVSWHGEAYPLILFNEPKEKRHLSILARAGDLFFGNELHYLTPPQITSVLLNCLADFEAGRLLPKPGFTEDHKESVRNLLSHYIPQLS